MRRSPRSNRLAVATRACPRPQESAAMRRAWSTGSSTCQWGPRPATAQARAPRDPGGRDRPVRCRSRRAPVPARTVAGRAHRPAHPRRRAAPPRRRRPVLRPAAPVAARRRPRRPGARAAATRARSARHRRPDRSRPIRPVGPGRPTPTARGRPIRPTARGRRGPSRRIRIPRCTPWSQRVEIDALASSRCTRTHARAACALARARCRSCARGDPGRVRRDHP
jgi:hypothetical protein